MDPWPLSEKVQQILQIRVNYIHSKHVLSEGTTGSTGYKLADGSLSSSHDLLTVGPSLRLIFPILGSPNLKTQQKKHS